MTTEYEVGNIQADFQNFYSIWKGHERNGEWADVNNSVYKKRGPHAEFAQHSLQANHALLMMYLCQKDKLII
jgi:hypothetical protein